MMRLLHLALLVPLLAMLALAAQDSEVASCSDALRKRYPDSDAAAVQSASKWLLDNFGAATAEDLNGVSNFAVDATSLASRDKSLSANAKTVLRRLFEAEAEKAAKLAESAPKERRMNAHASTSKKPMA